VTELRVLHVDDERVIREIVGLALEAEPGVVTRSCGSGQDALRLAQDWTPHIILLDVVMPGMDGGETLARLRDNPLTSAIPVVFMTAKTRARDLDHLRSLGAAGVIAKPFDPMTLGSSLRAYVEPSRAPLDALRASYLQRVSRDAARMAGHRPALVAGTADAAALEDIRRVAHALAGASGIFGLGEIGDAASVLEEAAAYALDGKSGPQDVAAPLDRLLSCTDSTSSRK
jgi:CheY-like chemotaxis protein